MLSTASRRDRGHLHSEIYYHSICRHKHIVTLYTVFINGSALGDTYFFVMEKLTGGELFDRLRSVRRFTEADASKVVGNITSALQYLHSRGIAHRDLKPGVYLCLCVPLCVCVLWASWNQGYALALAHSHANSMLVPDRCV